jgi:hypothetical protein
MVTNWRNLWEKTGTGKLGLLSQNKDPLLTGQKESPVIKMSVLTDNLIWLMLSLNDLTVQ